MNQALVVVHNTTSTWTSRRRVDVDVGVNIVNQAIVFTFNLVDRRLASSKSRETQQLPPWASQDVTVSSRIEEDRNEPIGVTLGNAYLNGSQSPSRTVIRRHSDSTGSLFWRLAVAASAIARGLCFHLPQVQHRPAAWVSN